jgi:hypothetical protein
MERAVLVRVPSDSKKTRARPADAVEEVRRRERNARGHPRITDRRALRRHRS